MMSSHEKMSSGPRLDELPIDAIQSLVLACIDVRACGRLSLASTGARDVVVTAEQTWQRHLGSAVSSSRWSRAVRFLRRVSAENAHRLRRVPATDCVRAFAPGGSGV